MRSKVDLVCIDPARIQEFWPHAQRLIRAAIERTGLSAFADVERDVLAGRQLLWLACTDRIEAAATTKLVRVGDGLVCVLVACGGERRERWLHLFEKIEDYARDEGCTRVRIYGRRGWERALSGYRAKHVILEKAI